MRTIYLDILFCVNFILDYMILVCVKKFLSLSCRLRRLLLGAAVGGVSSFVILLPPMPSGFSMIISLASACFVVGAAFAPLPQKQFFKAAASFFLVSFIFCGIMIAVWMLFTPEQLLIRNSSVYIQIPPLMLVVTALFCYVVMRMILRITGRGRPAHLVCKAEVIYKGHTIRFIGKGDTGNGLKEPFSGIPVIVVRRAVFDSVPELRSLHRDTITEGMRLVPYVTVGGRGLLPAFRAEQVNLSGTEGRVQVSAYIAICENEEMQGSTEAVIPYDLID